MEQVANWETFEDKGHDVTAPIGYKKIGCHMVCDVKHDGSCKIQLAAGGILKAQNSESVNSALVSRESNW